MNWNIWHAVDVVTCPRSLAIRCTVSIDTRAPISAALVALIFTLRGTYIQFGNGLSLAYSVWILFAWLWSLPRFGHTQSLSLCAAPYTASRVQCPMYQQSISCFTARSLVRLFAYLLDARTLAAHFDSLNRIFVYQTALFVAIFPTLFHWKPLEKNKWGQVKYHRKKTLEMKSTHICTGLGTHIQKSKFEADVNWRKCECQLHLHLQSGFFVLKRVSKPWKMWPNLDNSKLKGWAYIMASKKNGHKCWENQIFEMNSIGMSKNWRKAMNLNLFVWTVGCWASIVNR